MNNFVKNRLFFKNIFFVCCFVAAFLAVNATFAQVKIISPSKNDSLFVGKNIKIIWESPNQLVNLFYSIDNGTNWNLIASNIDTNIYVWTIPYISTKNLKLKVQTNETIELSRIFENTAAHNIESRSCDFSSDGKYFLTAGDDEYFRIWDIERRALLLEYKTTGIVYAAKFLNSVDSVIFAAGKHIFLWTKALNSAEELFNFSDIVDANTGEIVQDLAFNIDIHRASGTIAACSQEGYVKLFSLVQNKVFDSLSGYSANDSYYRCRFSRDGKKIAFVGYNKYLNVYDIENKQLKCFFATSGTANVLWGLDFTFDNQEIGITGLDGYIRRIDENKMALIAEYENLHSSSHIRAIRYVNASNDFVSGCLGGDLLFGNFAKDEFNKLKMDYQITDIEYFDNLYIGVVGREPRSWGMFTIFRIDKMDISSDEIDVQVYYKYVLDISQVVAIINQVVDFQLNFIPDFDATQIPFSTIPLTAYIAYPNKLLNNYVTSDLMLTKLDEIRGIESIYSHAIPNILNPTIFTAKARILLSDINFALIRLEKFHSENEMIALSSNYGFIEIIPECEMNAGRNILQNQLPAIELFDERDRVLVDLDIVSDELHTLVIMDIQGKIVLSRNYSKRGTYIVEIDKSQLSSGVYLAKLNTANIDIPAKKFIID